MKRLPISGGRLASLELEEDELRRVLGELGAAAVFDDNGIHEFYIKLAEIHGTWWAERAAKEVAPVVSTLGKLGTKLTEITALLSGHETGLHTAAIIETMSQVVRALGRDPSVGSLNAARALIDNFKSGAAKIHEASFAAFADLTGPSLNDGRDALRWYDDFTAILLEIAAKLGIEPALGKDRITGQRNGWLFDAARALERFFPSYMRSQSPEACGKRLERSRKRLLNTHRQNLASR